MMMPHPLLPVSLPPASVAMAMNQMNHLNTIANMAAAAQIHSPLSRAGASVIKVRIMIWKRTQVLVTCKFLGNISNTTESSV